MSELHVRLFRDSFNTPWGFRLQGGKDLGQRLSIQRVFSNSPAEGELQRGDLIVAISGRDGNELTHKQALDLIKHGGGQIQLIIQRPAPGRVSSTATFKPQRPRAPTLQQPPAPSMPAQQGGYGFQPKKVTLSSLGGGGPSFGSDYTHGRPASVSQPVRVQTGGYSPGHNNDMLNRVQTSLDNISLSPRTPEYGYQAPPFSQLSPHQQLSTGERLDIEREQEKQRQQQAKLQSQQYYQPPPQQQQQASPQYYQAPPQQASPNYQQASPSYQQQQQQPAYVPTGVRIDQEMGEDGEEIGTPVWERRRTFMNAPSKPAKAPSGKQGAPKVPKPTGGQSPFSFGTDYSSPQPKTSSVSWKPQAVQRPVNVAPPQPAQAAPAPWQQQQQQQQFYDTDKPDPPPAWRNSLKSTGVKPWDCDLEYTIGQQEGPRSVGFQPKGFQGPTPAYSPAPAQAAPPQPQGGRAGGGGGGADEGPQVVHLQYNSPMGLYSSQNVQETYAGQTKAMAAKGVSPGGSAPAAPAQKGPQGKDGDRDWTQSAVLRMIYEDEHRGMPQQRQQPPPPAPKPQAQFQQSFAPQQDEFGTSDF